MRCAVWMGNGQLGNGQMVCNSGAMGKNRYVVQWEMGNGVGNKFHRYLGKKVMMAAGYVVQWVIGRLIV